MHKFRLTALLFFITTFSFGQDFNVLLFSKTAGYRHSSIENGIAAIKKLGLENNFSVTSTEDAAFFTIPILQKYQAVIFLSTTGDILNTDQQKAFEEYIRHNGGFVGIHAASDTEYDWPWYGKLVGAYFKSHPAIQTATINVADHVHPSSAHLPYKWVRRDEWYNYSTNPRGQVHVLATLDEKTYSGGIMGIDHPIAWCHSFEGGRAFYTGGGHTDESYTEPDFLQHLLGGIRYAAGKIKGRFDATIGKNFDLTVLDAAPVQPMQLAVLPDLNVLYIERTGAIKLINQQSGIISKCGQIQVSTDHEDGLLGLALDPEFSRNRWIYLFYSPSGNDAKQLVSRFEFNNGNLDGTTEKVLLEIRNQRDECCHSSGALEFDKEGNLYISVGDNTNPFSSDGYAPTDQRPGFNYFDAQRTAANSKDLRGKILRIKPTPDGRYTIPEGNLFTDTSQGREEIYIMGCRNPFRMAIDKEKKILYWGEVGPDAYSDNPSRGPKGYDEINRTTTAGNFGWPYCIADNKPYYLYNFANKTPTSASNCDAPVNNSSNNTGIKNLPPARSAWIWYPYGASAEFPEVGSSLTRTAMAGAVYKYSDTLRSEIKFPAYYHDKFIFYDWTRNSFFEVTSTDEGDIIKINNLLSDIPFSRPIDMQFGPDGAMYVINWGENFWGGSMDSRIVKIGFIQEGRSPKAIIDADITNGNLPLKVNFSASRSFDPDSTDKIQKYFWDVDLDGLAESVSSEFSYTFTQPGTFQVRLIVTDSTGKKGTAVIEITAGNNRPVTSVTWPSEGGFFDWGEEIDFAINVTDEEDGSTASNTINCSRVLAEPSIGHDDHAHGMEQISNCIGTFKTVAHGNGQQNVYYILDASYTDNGFLNGNAMTGKARVILNPKKLYAVAAREIADAGTENLPSISPEGPYVTGIGKGGYIMFEPANLQKIKYITFKAGHNNLSGFGIYIYLDSLKGQTIGYRKIENTDGNLDYFTIEIPEIEGTHKLFFKFRNPVSSENGNSTSKIHSVEFHGQGISKADQNKSKGLQCSYFYKEKLSTEIHPMVSFSWNETQQGFSPAINSVTEWTGLIHAPSDGSYQFKISQQGGVANLWIEDELLIDSTVQNHESKILNWTQGSTHKLRIRYKRTQDNPAIYLSWKTPDQKYQVIHTDFLTHTDCNSDPGGTAFIDSCGNCSGGDTGILPVTNPAGCLTGVTEAGNDLIQISTVPGEKNTVKIVAQSDARFQLLTAGGQMVMQGEVKKGENQIFCSDCATGIYLLRFSTNISDISIKIPFY